MNDEKGKRTGTDNDAEKIIEGRGRKEGASEEKVIKDTEK